MKRLFCCILFGLASAAPAQDFLDRLGDRLTISTFNDAVRAHLSGTIDLEVYHFEQPTPGLLDTEDDTLLSPRLTLFLDAQAGSQIYFFSQVRLDRGFDPGERGANLRLDEYALRVTPWSEGWITLQVGKFATVVGSFVHRHLSWDNPFINAPLVYENITALEDRTGHLASDFQHARLVEKYEFIPVIWGPSYASGFSIAGKIQKFDYAFELKNRSLSSRPETWDFTDQGLSDPTASGRIGFRPNEMWNFGLSLSDGPYLFDPEGAGLPDSREQLIAQDISFAWHHLQIWAEFFEARFELPGRGTVGTFGWYLETKYKITPQFFASARLNQEIFGQVDAGPRQRRLGEDIWRWDVAAAYRFTPHFQVKLQYSFQHETTGAAGDNHIFATQATLRF